MFAGGPSSFKQSLYVVNVYSILAFLSFAIFGSLHVFVEGNPLVGYLELGGALAVMVTVLGLKLTRNVDMAKTFLLLTIVTLLVVMFVTGGTQGTGIFWAFMFPVAAFFLAGQREGLFWMALLFAVVVGMWALGNAGVVPFYYADITTRQLLVTLFVVTVGLYVYQAAREKSDRDSRASQKQLKQYLHQMSELHAKLDHTKNEFVTLASHQLRTPISTIGWLSEMLLNGDADHLNKDQREYIQGIYDSNRRMGAIVDAMLMVSSLEMDEVHVRPEPTDLKALTHRLFGEEHKKFLDKDFDIHEQYEDLPKIKLDPTVTKHILRNIFSNALKYTPPKGTVIVGISKSGHKLNADSKGSVVITVTDTGYGIPLHEQGGVFAKMFRAGNVKAKDTDGTGLGLFIVKALLDRVGGSISFSSQENRGTTFVVQLPLEGMMPNKHGDKTVVHG